MPLLFSYGTLQLARVQLATFQRLLQGAPDELRGWETSRVAINDAAIEAELGTSHYTNVVFNGSSESSVAGTALEVTAEELAAADEYERDARYVRAEVTLASGRTAWVYFRK